MESNSIRKIVIVAGADTDLASNRELLQGAYLIGADRGALFLVDNGYRVDASIGDFDSVSESEMNRIRRNSVSIISLSCDKDDTDIEHAVKYALGMEGIIHILGATGSRQDQTFSAVNLLKICHDHCREAYIHDSNNRIRIIDGSVCIKKSGFRYVSLIPYGDDPVKVSLKGLKYSGENIILERKTSRGISNEIVGEEAVIKSDGCLFVFEAMD